MSFRRLLAKVRISKPPRFDIFGGRFSLSSGRTAFLLSSVLCLSLLMQSCSSVSGYPKDPENSGLVLSSLAPYFDPGIDAQYYAESDPTLRKQKRDLIILSRMRAYDIEFSQFEMSLYSDGNSIAAGGDLAAIVINTVAATSGGAATKAVLSASAAAVVGAQGVVNKDLFYQRTIPALLSQMEANRATAKAAILIGIKQPDSDYSLAQAYVDLETLKSGGSIPRAISGVTKSATDSAKDAEAQVQQASSFQFTTYSNGTLISNWLYKNGVGIKTHLAELNDWMKNDASLHSTTLPDFLHSAAHEQDRQRAIAALPIR